MAISLQRFREKAQAGDAERLEINRAGTDLHRKGMSPGGKAVEWIRDAAGARKAENTEVMHAFVAALKAEHGELIFGSVGTALQGQESKPLSSRQVRQIIDDAVTLRDSNRQQNQQTALQFAPTDGSPGADAIRKAIEAAGQDGKRVVTDDEARAIAQQKIAEFELETLLPASVPAAKALMDQVKVFSAQRLNALANSPELEGDARLQQQVMRDMGAQIGKLGNTELLKLYRTTLSADMVEFRLALANHQDDPRACLLLEDLNSYEAMVHTEVIERSLQQAPEVDDFQVIDHGPKLGQLGALVNTEKRAAHRELAFQSDSYLRGENTDRSEHPGATAKLANTGLTVEQVADELRSADLTINMGLRLFAKGGPFRDPSGGLVTSAPRMKNIYELPQKKGPDYLERRKMVEYALEPATEHADRSGIDPSNHPISAGVNVGRRIGGAAPGYGEVVLVLKDSVKDRCTFTPGDSFNAFEARVTPEKIARYKATVHDMLQPGGGLPDDSRKALLEHPTALNTVFTELDAMAGQDFGAGRPFLDALMRGPLREVDPGKATLLNYRLANAAIDIFRETPEAGGHVTTPERMSHMIPDFNEDVVQAITTGVKDEGRINLAVNDYIEAQVYGGIDLANDVAEIRFLEKDIGAMTPQQKREYLDSVDGLRQMASELGVRVVQYKPEEAELTRFDT